MRQTRRKFLEGVAATGVALTAAGPVTASDDARFIVSGGRGVRNRVERSGFDVQHELADGRVLVVTGPDDRDALAAVSGVKHAARDYQFELETPAETADTSVDEQFYPLQWDKQVTDAAVAHETATGAGTTIAVIDTGVYPDHPDLRGNVDADAGRLFKYGEITADSRDVYGHGTHVAGIAAGSDDGTTGIVGVAPDATVVSLRVFWYEDIDGDGEQELTTTTADILTAIDYAADLGVDVMNMSIGTPPLAPQAHVAGTLAVEQTVIQSAVTRGSVVVASAGNAAADLQHGGYFTLPNSTAGAMSVSATGPNDELVYYSNYGTNEVDVGAPGGGYETYEKTLATDTEWPFPANLVLSTVPPDLYGGSYYAYFAGTSMAAPQVTGTAALAREVAPEATPNQVEQAIEQGAEGVTGQNDAELGAGRLNVANALDTSALK